MVQCSPFRQPDLPGAGQIWVLHLPQGDSDGSVLTPFGQEQARRTRDALSRMPFDRWHPASFLFQPPASLLAQQSKQSLTMSSHASPCTLRISRIKENRVRLALPEDQGICMGLLQKVL
jgi:hypothetical protein